MAATAFISLPTPRQTQRPFTASFKYPFKPSTSSLLSLSSSVSVVEDDPSPPPPGPLSVQSDSATNQLTDLPYRKKRGPGKFKK